MKYFYCVETDEIMTVEQIQTEWERYKTEEEGTPDTFPEFLEQCMTYNNGTLQTIEQHYNAVADRLRRTDEDDTDEREALAKYLNDLEKLMQEGREKHVVPHV